jgi:hypothetical protein
MTVSYLRLRKTLLNCKPRSHQVSDDPQLHGRTYSLVVGNRPMVYTPEEDDDFLILYDCT